MTVLVLLVPALVLLAGALLSVIPLPIPYLARNLIRVVSCVVSGVAVLLLATAFVTPVTVFEPNTALPTLAVALQWSGVALPWGLVFLLVTAGRFLIGLETDSPRQVFGGLVAASGVLLFLAADNWTTVTLAWIVVELGLLAIPAEEGEIHDSAARALGWNLIAITMWLTAGMVLSNAASSLRLDEVSLNGVAGFLVLGAIWFRSGLYPFHSAAPANINTLGARLGIPLLLGGYLMTQFLTSTSRFASAQDSMVWSNELEIVAVLSVGLSALIVVGQAQRGDAFVWLLRAFVAPILLLPFVFPSPLSAALSAGIALAAFVICNFLDLALDWRAQPERVPLTLVVWLAALWMIASLPLTPAFWSRAGMLASSYASGQLGVWLLLVGGMALLLAPLWREIFASREVAPRAVAWNEYAALGCILLPALVIGLVPGVFTAPFGSIVADAGAAVSNAFFQPANLASLIFLLAGLGVPVLASFELARRWTRRIAFLPARLTNALELTGLGGVLDLAYRLTRAIVQQSITVLEQPPVAWLMFLAIWIAVWLIGLSV